MRQFRPQHHVTAPMNQSLSNEQLRASVPSIFALEPWQRMSERYRFVPTIQVLDRMREEGFLPVRAMQGGTRIEGKGVVTKHMIRLRHRSVMDNPRFVGQEYPEIVLLNSHDGTSAYQLFAGIFRLVCLNGMVVESSNFGKVRARHSGSEDLPSRVIDASYQVIESAPAIMDQVESMKALPLTREHQLAFARAASELRPTKLEIDPARLLEVRRQDDIADPSGNRDLWRTMNVVQENIMRGGQRGLSANNARRRTREVSSVTDDIRINRGLWRLAEEMGKLAA
jgi:hypothetical protein